MLLNAVAGHSLDRDDWEIPGNSHASVVMLPALLAASEGEPFKLGFSARERASHRLRRRGILPSSVRARS